VSCALWISKSGARESWHFLPSRAHMPQAGLSDGNGRGELHVRVEDGRWRCCLGTCQRTTDQPFQLASLRLVRGFLVVVVSKVSEPALESDVMVALHALAAKEYCNPAFFPFSFRTSGTYCDCSRYPELAPLGLLGFCPVELLIDVS
jgi:hypothetical protein